MTGMEIFQIWIIAFFTVALLSFLYKDNPLYRLAEHIFAGLSAGYYVGLVWHEVILRQLWTPLQSGGHWMLLIPLLLGTLMFGRFFPKYAWISRTPLAFVMAVTAGIFLISQLHGMVLPQVKDTMSPSFELVVVDSTGYDTFPDQLVIVDSIAPDSPPVQSGNLLLSKRDVARTGDSVTISTTFTDPEMPTVDRLAFTLKLRLPDDLTHKALVLAGGPTAPGVQIIDNGGGSYTASYTYVPDTLRPVGPYDISYSVSRAERELALNILVLLGVISTLIYFYFSKEHTGALGVGARVGIWFIMIGFGAHFGYTVMGRVSLLIGRVQFLIDDWLGSFPHIF